MPRHPLSEPWLITPAGLELVLAIASREDLFKERLALAREERGVDKPLANDANRMIVQGDVAVIPVIGPLVRHGDMLAEISGATSYARIRKDLRTALDAPDVARIVFRYDTPGGEAAGCGELAEEIRASTAKKPITAYAEHLCCSAGYWLATAAGRLIAAPSATLGSIGVCIAFSDSSAADEKSGKRRYEIVSSQSPNKRGTPVDDEVIAHLQQRCDDLAAVFIGDVARYRGVKVDTVLADFGAGGVLIGTKAVKAGLADRLGSLNELLSGPYAAPRASGIASPSKWSARSSGAITMFDTKRFRGLHVALFSALALAQEGQSSADPAEADFCGRLATALPPLCGDVQAQCPEAAKETASIGDLLALRDKVVQVTGEKTGLVGAVDALHRNAKAAELVSERAQVNGLVEEMVMDGQIGPEERAHYQAYSLADAQSSRRLLRKDKPRQQAHQSEGVLVEEEQKPQAAADQTARKERADNMILNRGKQPRSN